MSRPPVVIVPGSLHSRLEIATSNECSGSHPGSQRRIAYLNWTDWNTLLEEACGELGYSFEEMENFLESGKYPEELVGMVMSMAGLDDKPTAVEGMNTQRTQFLAKVKLALKEKAKAKSEAEAKIQAKVQSIGRCPMGFAWDKVDGGWRCQGGSHFVDNASVNRVSD